MAITGLGGTSWQLILLLSKSRNKIIVAYLTIYDYNEMLAQFLKRVSVAVTYL